MRTVIFTAIAAACLTAVSVQAQSDQQQSGDDVTVKPQETKISDLADKAEFGGDGYTSNDGEVLYKTLCAGCHMADGSGAVGAGKYPALKNNKNLQYASYPIHIIVNGQGAMPALGTFLDDGQVVALTSYIQSNLDNGYEFDATTAMVAASRPAGPARPTTEEHE